MITHQFYEIKNYIIHFFIKTLKFKEAHNIASFWQFLFEALKYSRLVLFFLEFSSRQLKLGRNYMEFDSKKLKKIDQNTNYITTRLSDLFKTTSTK